MVKEVGSRLHAPTLPRLGLLGGCNCDGRNSPVNPHYSLGGDTFATHDAGMVATCGGDVSGSVESGDDVSGSVEGVVERSASAARGDPVQSQFRRARTAATNWKVEQLKALMVAKAP